MYGHGRESRCPKRERVVDVEAKIAFTILSLFEFTSRVKRFGILCGCAFGAEEPPSKCRPEAKQVAVKPSKPILTTSQNEQHPSKLALCAGRHLQTVRQARKRSIDEPSESLPPESLYLYRESHCLLVCIFVRI
jgi:hypothetical protein